jgi:hypothetical protein
MHSARLSFLLSLLSLHSQNILKLSAEETRFSLYFEYRQRIWAYKRQFSSHGLLRISEKTVCSGKTLGRYKSIRRIMEAEGEVIAYLLPK